MANNQYIKWLADTKAEETKAKKAVAYMASYLKTCYHIETSVRNPNIDLCTTPISQWDIEAVDQTADQLDSLYSELDGMMEDIKRMQKAIAELSDIRRELTTTTPADFEN